MVIVALGVMNTAINSACSIKTSRCESNRGSHRQGRKNYLYHLVNVTNNRDDSNEYGVRQLTINELKIIIFYKCNIRKKMKVPSGTLNLEMFEMLESLDSLKIISNAF